MWLSRRCSPEQLIGPIVGSPQRGDGWRIGVASV
jgi:hypothetical protein